MGRLMSAFSQASIARAAFASSRHLRVARKPQSICVRVSSPELVTRTVGPSASVGAPRRPATSKQATTSVRRLVGSKPACGGGAVQSVVRFVSLLVAVFGLLAGSAANAQKPETFSDPRSVEHLIALERLLVEQSEKNLSKAQNSCDPLYFAQTKASTLDLEQIAQTLERSSGTGPAAAAITSSLRAAAAILRAELTKIRALEYKPCAQLSDSAIIPLDTSAIKSMTPGDFGFFYKEADEDFEESPTCDRAEFEKRKQALILYLDERASYVQWHIFPPKVEPTLAKQLGRYLESLGREKARISAIEFVPCPEPQQPEPPKHGFLFTPSKPGQPQPVSYPSGASGLPRAPVVKFGENVGYKIAIPPPNIDFEFAANGTAGHASGAAHSFLALDVGGVLTLGAVQYQPDGTETGFEAGGRLGFADDQSPTPRDRIFFAFSFFNSSYSDRQSLGTLDPAGARLGIPGTGDPGSASPAGFSVGPPNTVTDMQASFDSDATGATFSVGTELPLSPRFSISPSIGFQWTGIDQTTGFSGDIQSIATTFSYDTDIRSDRVSAVFSAEFAYTPDYRLGSLEFEYYATPTIYLDRLGFSGTDRFEISGAANDNQQVGLDGSGGGLGAGVRLGVEVHPENLPVSFYAGVSAERRINDVTVFRSGETGEQSRGVIGYQGTIAAAFGLKIGF